MRSTAIMYKQEYGRNALVGATEIKKRGFCTLGGYRKVDQVSVMTRECRVPGKRVTKEWKFGGKSKTM
ncbi:hypothetical protein QJS04_geneDACA024948 [Acorus gramineus]|uniref:Uncharacterized protein n=1 Tax=Acorus gramineus TaxID=55184 RepID=A0AAV9A3C0_ACOGR|nr:hypothetical protein QJS04_geneDACA024948 [Acorus gramineus]